MGNGIGINSEVINIVSKNNVLSDRGIPKKKLQNGLSFKKFKIANPIWPSKFLKTNFEFLKTKVICNQRPQKPPSNEIQANTINFQKLCPPY